MVQILDGRKVAETLSENLSKSVAQFKEISGRSPCLTALRVGEHPPSLIYLKRKREAAERLGIRFQEKTFPETVSLSSLQTVLMDLNAAPDVDGIILQLPLPSHLDPSLLLCCIHPQKDVDGLHPLNQGFLLTYSFEGIIPCTPLACLKLIQAFGFNVKGKRCVVIGRSALVGKPLGVLLLNHHATVTFCHSQTLDLETVTREADFLFVAMGKPGFIQASHVKTGACVVDVGIHRLPSQSGDTLQGDVCFESVSQVAGALSPVPGGVGPLTVFSLMENTLKAAYRTCGLILPIS
ncbi:MAG: bifunctional 5,10-methylenetetrahydrofolate dehydrogenase/5,10-methenyltetrahydrofolate cyclohydrolase [Alphaproteobacteria bacterium]